MNDLSVKVKFHVGNGKTGHKELREGEAPEEVPTGRIPRISKLMALAIRFDQLIRDGVVANQAEIARLGFVSRARVSQVMDLLNLDPAIQEALLFLPRVERGRDPVTERELRAVVAEADWGRQHGCLSANPLLSRHVDSRCDPVRRGPCKHDRGCTTTLPEHLERDARD